MLSYTGNRPQLHIMLYPYFPLRSDFPQKMRKNNTMIGMTPSCHEAAWRSPVHFDRLAFVPIDRNGNISPISQSSEVPSSHKIAYHFNLREVSTLKYTRETSPSLAALTKVFVKALFSPQFPRPFQKLATLPQSPHEMVAICRSSMVRWMVVCSFEWKYLPRVIITDRFVAFHFPWIFIFRSKQMFECSFKVEQENIVETKWRSWRNGRCFWS